MSALQRISDWDAIEQRMIAWRRDLHKIPELGFELPQTSRYIQETLDELGISYHTLVDGMAVVGLIEGRQSDNPKTVALRADMDALPVQEETGLAFASTNGAMHACGHDGHMSMLLGAAAWLQAHRDEFTGKVKLLFQPAEELPSGAQRMMEEGCLQDPDVSAVFGIHTGQMSTELEADKIGFRVGTIMAAVDILKITIHGHGGHAAYPETTIDPIPIAAELILALQTLISRETSAFEQAVLSITQLRAGHAMNVIPDEVELVGTIRTTDPETRERLAKRIRELTTQLTAAHHATCTIEHQFPAPALVNDSELTALAKAAAAKIVDPDRLQDLVHPVMGAEDFAFYAEAIPSCFVFQYAMEAVDKKIYGHHNCRFALDESKLVEGAKLHAQFAKDFLNREIDL